MNTQRRKFTATVTATFHFEGEASHPEGAVEVLSAQFVLSLLDGYRSHRARKCLNKEFRRASAIFRFEDDSKTRFRAGLFKNRKKGKTK